MADTSLEMNGVSATAEGEIVVHRFPTRDLVTARNYLLIGGIPDTESTVVLYRRTGANDANHPSATDGISILGSRLLPLPAWGALGILSLPDRTGHIVVATLAPVSSVPEPATLASLLLGLGGLGLRAIRHRRAG